MKMITHQNYIFLTSLTFGLAFLILPTSVFSQEQTNIVEGGEVGKDSVEDVNSYTHPYDVDQLSGEVFGDFVIGPGKYEITLRSGESSVVDLTVSNRTGETKIFKLEVEDIEGSLDPKQSVILLGEDKGPYTLKDYISVPQSQFELKHNERAHVPVTVSLPADAEPGGRYGSVLVSTVSRNAELNPEGGAAPSSAIVSRLGTLFFVTAPGNVSTEGELVSFHTIPNKKIFFEGPIDMGLVFENTGSVHLNPYGEISISNIIGDEVGFVQLDPWFILPKSVRTREVSWDRELLMGRYTATAHVNKGYDGQFEEVSFTFWVLPVKLILKVFGSLFLFFLVIYFFITRFELKRR